MSDVFTDETGHDVIGDFADRAALADYIYGNICESVGDFDTSHYDVAFSYIRDHIDYDLLHETMDRLFIITDNDDGTITVARP